MRASTSRTQIRVQALRGHLAHKNPPPPKEPSSLLLVTSLSAQDRNQDTSLLIGSRQLFRGLDITFCCNSSNFHTPAPLRRTAPR